MFLDIIADRILHHACFALEIIRHPMIVFGGGDDQRAAQVFWSVVDIDQPTQARHFVQVHGETGIIQR